MKNNMKATAIAPVNNALTKYWGKKDEDLRLPLNSTISVNLSKMLTTTTVEFSPTYDQDFIEVNGSPLTERESLRVIKHLSRIRRLAQQKQKAKVASTFNFPMSVGLSSSASGFAALTVAGVHAAGLNLTEKELTILARQASGSACRSIPDGFVEWITGDSNETSYAYSIFPHTYWDIVDIAVVVSLDKKNVPSTEGQKLVTSSRFLEARLKHIAHKNELMKQFIQDKNFVEFGALVEGEALELHAIMLTSIPSLIYWTPGTLTLMQLVKKWRIQGTEVYFTINTGQNIHLICEKKDAETVKNKLGEIKDVKDIIVNHPAPGARLSDKHLF